MSAKKTYHDISDSDSESNCQETIAEKHKSEPNSLSGKTLNSPKTSNTIEQKMKMSNKIRSKRSLSPRPCTSSASVGNESEKTDSPPKKKTKCEKGKASRSTAVSIWEDSLPFNFLLTKVNGIPEQFNDSLSLHISDILSVEMGDLLSSVQFNYVFDIPWLIQQYPLEHRSKPMLIVHGMQTGELKELQKEASTYKNISLAQARLEITYGTHHTKMMLLRYVTGLRVVIHTSNLIHKDWHQKTQGMWVSPVFPKIKDPMKTAGESPTHFKRDLYEYLSAYKLSPLQEWTQLVMEHDMAQAKVFIIGSVPGRHKKLFSWGHMKLRKVLQENGPGQAQMKSWPLIGQFSSIGSLGPNKDQWLCGEWLQSLASTKQDGKLASFSDRSSSHLNLIFPTVDNVRTSLEGYPAGASIPYSIKNAQKQQYLHSFFHKWRATQRGRSLAMPHIKTYCRVSPDCQQLAWFLLTSSNLSKAAWGALEKQHSQLMIRSYELGVLFLPKYYDVGDFFTVLDDLDDWQAGSSVFPLPWDLPLSVHGPKDKPWVWDIRYTNAPDRNGNIWCPS